MFAKRYFTQENAFLAGLGGFCVVYIVQSLTLGNLSARFPRAVALFALFLILWMLVGRAFKAAQAGRVNETPSTASEVQLSETAPEWVDSPKKGKTIHWLLMCLITLIYPGLIVVMGFPLTTIFYLAGIGHLMAYKLWKGLIFSVIYTAIVVLLFQYILDVPLPVGMLWEKILGL